MTPVVRCAAILSLSIITLNCNPKSTTGRLRYPVARTVNVVDDYHGTKVADPYRWLEDLESEEVRRWAAAQNAIA